MRALDTDDLALLAVDNDPHLGAPAVDRAQRVMSALALRLAEGGKADSAQVFSNLRLGQDVGIIPRAQRRLAMRRQHHGRAERGHRGKHDRGFQDACPQPACR